MGKYEVSVLITFYNQEKYVDECLKSVFMQKTTFPFKVIIGDDGSTDGTIEKIGEWQKRYPGRISYIVMPREEGKKYIGGTRASQNRLAILDKVDTPYFQYLDGDDYWTDKNKLQLGYDVLEKLDNKECCGCAHAITMFHEDDPTKTQRLPGIDVKEGKYQIKEYWKDMYFHTDTILFRSENIKKIPRKLLEDSFNDNLITFSFMQFGPMYYLNKDMAAYRQNNDGIWAGEKQIVSAIRELILYDIELKINRSLRKVIIERHFRNFVFLHRNYKMIDGLEAYYEIAEKYDLPTTKRVIKHKSVFTGSHTLDSLIFYMRSIQRRTAKWIKRK